MLGRRKREKKTSEKRGGNVSHLTGKQGELYVAYCPMYIVMAVICSLYQYDTSVEVLSQHARVTVVINMVGESVYTRIYWEPAAAGILYILHFPSALLGMISQV